MIGGSYYPYLRLALDPISAIREEPLVGMLALAANAGTASLLNGTGRIDAPLCLLRLDQFVMGRGRPVMNGIWADLVYLSIDRVGFARFREFFGHS